MTNPDRPETEPKTTIRARAIPADAAPEKRAPQGRPLRETASGAALLLASAFTLSLALLPIVLDRISGDLFEATSGSVRSAAPTWPSGGQPWLWPNWAALLALCVSAGVLCLWALSAKLPNLAVLGLAGVLAAATARASWSSFDVVNARLWEIAPVCLVCIASLLFALTATIRWRADPRGARRSGIGVVLFAMVLAGALTIGGTAFVRAERDPGASTEWYAKPGEPLLLAQRAADAPQVRDLPNGWAAQLASGQVTDETSATAIAGAYLGIANTYPALLARQGDVTRADSGDATWIVLLDQTFPSAEATQAWCAANTTAPTPCVPLELAE